MNFSEEHARTIKWYHGVLTVMEAERRLLSKGVQGYYLLRKRDQRHNEYVLSYCSKLDEVKHLLIPSQQRHALLFKNPELNTLEGICQFIIEKFKSDKMMFLFQLNSDEVLNDPVELDERSLEPFPCTVCPGVFASDKQLKGHLDNHRVHFCQDCHSVILRTNAHNHGESCSKKATQTTFECPQCNFSTKQKRSLERHLRAHGEGKKSHVCQVCRSSFNSKKLLETHIFKHHPQCQEFPCDLCEKQFISPVVRDKHVKKDHGPPKKTYSCTDCHKECRTPKELKTHMDVHTKTKNVRPEVFECETCGYKTKVKSNLIRHMEKWHGPRRPVVISSLKYWEIITSKLMSIKSALEIAKKLREILGPEHFEKNLEATLRECLNQFRDDFENEIVYWRDSKNRRIKSTLVWAKDLETIVARVIFERKIANPRIIFSFDGGNNKLIICMNIIDLDDPSDSEADFMSNGRRQAIIVARGDWAPENLYNWQIILAKLKLFDQDHFCRDFVVTGDLKVMNCFSGIHLKILLFCE